MSPEKAQNTIKVAALVVGGVYLYRRFTEGSAVENGGHQVTPLGRWLVGWGVVFFSLSVISGYWPGLAGELAVLIMITTLITNGVQIAGDLHKGLGKAPAKGVTSSQTTHGHEASTETTPGKSIYEPQKV